VNSYWFRSVDERAGRRDSFSCAWVRYQTIVTNKIASGSGISKPPRWELLYKRRVRGIVTYEWPKSRENDSRSQIGRNLNLGIRSRLVSGSWSEFLSWMKVEDLWQPDL